MNQVIYYGSHLVEFDTKVEREGKDNNVPTLFLRNILEISDSISILVRQSSIEPTKILLRSLIENSLALAYMLEKNEKQRALSYMVFITNEQIKHYSKFMNNEPSSNQFKIQLEKDNLKTDFGKFFDHPNFRQVIKSKKSMLAQEQFQEIQEEYLRTKRNNHGRVKTWYSLFDGPKNIFELAEYLKKTIRYEFFYRKYSQTVHAQDIFKGMAHVEEDFAQIIQIRNFKDSQPVIQTAISTLLEILTNFIDKRIPDKKNDFTEWYLTIRDSFIELNEKKFINYKE